PCPAAPTPPPSQTATATAPPTATATATATVPPPTPTPTPTPMITISGTVVYCSNPSLNPVPGVTLSLTGDATDSALSDGSGNYSFTENSGGNYVVTPSKAALPPGSSG